jgi:starvation-inducible DNA-binding protein
MMVATRTVGVADERAQALGRVLADTYTLYLKTHFFHWNVTGPMFQELHLLFDQQYNELWLAVDVIAERMRALGFTAPGTSGALARLSSITEDDAVPDARTMIARLLAGHEAVAASARTALALADRADDPVTVDLMTQRLLVHEKTAWMLRSMLA